jgi:hypothetical protein
MRSRVRLGLRDVKVLDQSGLQAIGVVTCLALEATAEGATGIAGRQHIIADYDRLIFGPMPGGTHIALNEFSIASCVGPISITGDVRLHALVAEFSKLNMACPMALPQPVKFDYFADASLWSVINANGGSFTGPGATASSGIRCYNYLSVVNYPENSDFPGDSGRCSGAGLPADGALAGEVAGMKAELDAISSSLAAERAAVRAQIDAVGAGMKAELDAISSSLATERAAVRAQIDVVGAQIDAVGAQIDDIQHAENVQRRHERLVAVILLLVLIAAGTVAYRRLANRTF